MLLTVTTAKSRSDWLDRLRSNKGIPATDNLDIDHFLSHHHHNSNSNSEPPHSDDKRLPPDRTEAVETNRVSEDTQWYGVMTNVLCDLFNMGGPNEKSLRFSGKRISRKQSNPKFCDLTTANAIGSLGKDEYDQAATATLHSDNNSNVGINADWGEHDVNDEGKEKCGGGSRCDRELKGFSRSEVTVIDTSFQVWKFDKLAFRRKNTWKIRDKKGKSWTFGSKKRKGNHLESGSGIMGLKKKAKTFNLELSSSKESIGGDFVLPSADKVHGGLRKEISKDASEDYFQVPKKRKIKKNSSSVIIIKAIPPTSKKYARNIPKDTQTPCKS